MPSPSRAKREEAQAQKRADLQREAQVRKERKAAPKPAPAAPATPGTVRQTISGEKENAPLMGDVVRVPAYADAIVFRVTDASGPGQATLLGTLNADDDWRNAGHLATLDLQAGPCGQVSYGRPPEPQPFKVEASYTHAVRSGEVIREYRGEEKTDLTSTTPRYPALVRVAVYPLGRRTEYEASVEIEWRSTS